MPYTLSLRLFPEQENKFWIVKKISILHTKLISYDIRR